MTATDLDHAALLAALHAALDADPSDAATRLLLADLLEGQGDRVAAQGQRWQVPYGRWPVEDDGGYRWWDAACSDYRDPDDIPTEVFRLLPGGPEPVVRYYPSRRDAEADLARALEALAVRGAVLAGYDGEPCPWCGERKRVSSGRERACETCGRRWTA